jgi:hypothetical protein
LVETEKLDIFYNFVFKVYSLYEKKLVQENKKDFHDLLKEAIEQIEQRN